MKSPGAQDGAGLAARALRAGLVLLLVLVAFVALLAALVDNDAVANRIKDRALPLVSQKLGREVRIENVSVSVFPAPRAVMEGLRIAGRGTGGAALPLLEAERVSVNLRLWPLIRSLGQEISFSRVEMKRAVVNAVRGKDSVWSYEGLGEPVEAGRTPPPSAEPELAIDELAVRDGRLRIVDESAGPAQQAAVAIRDIEGSLRNITSAGTMHVDLKGALASSKRNLKTSLGLSPGPTPQAPLRAEGTITLEDADLRRFRSFFPEAFAQMLSRGGLDATGVVSTAQDGSWQLRGRASTEDLQLRGEPANAGFQLLVSAHPDDPTKTARVRFNKIRVNGPGMELGGSAMLQFEPMQASFVLEGELLDLDALLALMPPEEAPPSSPGTPGAADASVVEEETLLPPAMREQLRSIGVTGSIFVKKVFSGGLTAEDLRASAEMRRGVLRFPRATARLFNGSLNADGSSIDLGAAQPAWQLRGKLDAVDLGAAMASVSGQAPVQGRLSGTLDLKGVGNAWARLQKSLDGRGAMRIADGSLRTVDVGSHLAGPLGRALQMAGFGGAAGRVEDADRATRWRDLVASFTIRDGWLQIAKPITAVTPFGEVALGGRIGLGQQLDLTGEARLAPEYVSAIAGRAVPIQGPVAIPLALGGTLGQPAIGGPQPEAIARALIAQGPAGRAKSEAQKRSGQARDEAQEQANEALRRARRGLKRALP